MTVCGFCHAAIRKSGISCDVCSNQFHSACVSEQTDLTRILEKTSGLSWKCSDCIGNCITVNQSDLSKLIEEKIETALSTLTSTFISLKNEFLKLTSDKLTNLNETKVINQPKYSDILRSKSQPAVIIQPKKQDQPNAQTKSDINEKINPLASELRLSKVKNIKNGGMLIGCKSKADNDKFKKLAQETLADSYEVREVRGISPRIRVVGITENYSENVLLDYLKKLNTDIFSENCDCKLIKFFATKKNKNIYQAILQIDRFSYDKVIQAGNLFIGYDSCVVFDAIDIHRCFTCNEFHHSSNNCDKPVSCPRCAQSHEVRLCKSETLVCCNCLKLKNVPSNHAAWDTKKCTAYIRARDKLRTDILALTAQ